MERGTRQGRLVALGLCAELVLFVGFFGSVYLTGEAQDVAIIATTVAALVSFLVGIFVEGCALTLIFFGPSLFFLLVMGGMLNLLPR